MDELKMNNAPQVGRLRGGLLTREGQSHRTWAKHQVLQKLGEGGCVCGTNRRSGARGKSERWTSIGGLKPADPGKERRRNKMNEYGEYNSWEEMDQARERHSGPAAGAGGCPQSGLSETSSSERNSSRSWGRQGPVGICPKSAVGSSKSHDRGHGCKDPASAGPLFRSLMSMNTNSLQEVARETLDLWITNDQA